MGQTRLPKFAVPQRYNLHLIPDLSLCSFSGTIIINLSINEPTKFIVLNALKLNIHEVLFTNSHNQVIIISRVLIIESNDFIWTKIRACFFWLLMLQKYYPSYTLLDCDDEILVLVFPEILGVGEGVLQIKFSGMLNEHLRGFYKW